MGSGFLVESLGVEHSDDGDGTPFVEIQEGTS